MKTKIFLFSIIFLVAFIGIEASAAQFIESYDVHVAIGKNSELAITEKIKYDFGAEELHGIRRGIPVEYPGASQGETKHLVVSIASVTDEKGNPLKYRLIHAGPEKKIEVGDPDGSVKGKQSYVITYVVKGAIDYMKDNDRLIWNLTGNRWNIPILRAFATITLPSGISESAITSSCFRGVQGSRQPCGYIKNKATSGIVDSIDIADKELGRNEGLTAVITFPKGNVDYAPVKAKKDQRELLVNVSAVAIPLAVIGRIVRYRAF